MDLDLDGDTAVVMASTSGLGYGVARAFVREGANVVVNGRDETKLDAARTELESMSTGGGVAAVAADLTDPAAATELVTAAVDSFGGLDHVVTNSGGIPSGPFTSLSDAEWQAAFDGVVLSVVRLLRAAIPHLEDGGGTIVSIGSRSVKEPHESLVLSSSVRPCVAGLIKSLSRELAPDVRANVVLPGPHETAGIRSHVEDGVERGSYASYDEGLASLVDDVPLERMGDPDEFGSVVAFLCSERANYVTGESLLIEGGSSRSVL
ncbi:SDR family oxidoreductase [Salinigranum salinum]|uniref:SDR family oxidoreductase n=1 Tax=Salinigranum salinum TaxID=1364937 RepID=UPI001260BFA6|nr:SDR family oxidoreductase [Salinigranum salinum]